MTAIPLWVSRENADGQIAQFTVNIWVHLMVCMLALVNAIGWGAYGVYSLGNLVI